MRPTSFLFDVPDGVVTNVVRGSQVPIALVAGPNSQHFGRSQLVHPVDFALHVSIPVYSILDVLLLSASF